MFEPLSTLVRLRRDQLGLSLDALSALSRVSRTRLVALEKGDDNISLELLVKVANALKLNEIRVGGLRVEPATPDFNALVAAADALYTARKVVDQAVSAARDLERVAGPVADLLAPVLPPPTQRGVAATANLEKAAKLFRQGRRTRRTA